MIQNVLSDERDSESFVIEVDANICAGVIRGILDIEAGLLEVSLVGIGAVTLVISVHPGQVEGIHGVFVFLQLDGVAVLIQNLDIQAQGLQLLHQNPTFVLLLGMCPTLATTTSAINGMSMGLATLFVLVLSNMAISLIAPYIPDKVRIPSYIVVIATFVTLLQFVMQAYVPDIYETLGLFIPLIVVNCIVLGRAEAFANKNGVLDSALDGLGIGLGFTCSLTLLGVVREILGSGSVFGLKFIEGDGILAFVLAPGAFIALGYLIVVFRKLTSKKAE